jgi:DNA adenine methylase
MFKWSGGKYDELARILPRVPAEFRTPGARQGTYVEPFFGGGALLFALRPNKAVVSDTHKEAVAFYRQIAAGKGNELADWCAAQGVTSDDYYRVRNKQPTPAELAEAAAGADVASGFEVGARFYYLRKTAYRGMLRYNKKGGYNIPYGRYKRVCFDGARSATHAAVMANTTVRSGSWTQLLPLFSDPDAFVFLDPPYDSPFANYGYYDFGKEDQKELRDAVVAAKARVLMVIGSTDYIRELYDGYVVAEYPKKYRFRLHSKRVKADDIDNTHLVIQNREW